LLYRSPDGTPSGLLLFRTCIGLFIISVMLQRLKKDRIRAGRFAILFNASWVLMGLFDQFFFVSCLVRLQFLRFQMTPNPLIRIEIRRVRRQVKQLSPFLAGDDSL